MCSRPRRYYSRTSKICPAHETGLPSECSTVLVHTTWFGSRLTSLTLPHNLTSVGQGAFKCCNALTFLALPNKLARLGSSAFESCGALTSISLPHKLKTFGHSSFKDCKQLDSVIFRPRVAGAFIAWAVGSSRNRTNWQLTIVQRLRNVLRLITALALERRDVADVDPCGRHHIFKGCAVLAYPLGLSVD